MSTSLVRIDAVPPVFTPAPDMLANPKLSYTLRSPFIGFRLANRDYLESGQINRFVLFLGNLYPAHIFDDAVHGHETIGLWAAIQLVAGAGRPTEQRSMYRYTLHDAQQTAYRERMPANHLYALSVERAIIEARDEELLWEPIGQHLDKDTVPGHWLWTGRRSRNPSPSVNVMGMHDVPVYRVLWPSEQPDFLPADRHPVRTPNCPIHGITRFCVRPLHYMLSEETSVAPNPRTRRGQPDGRTRSTVRWIADATNTLRCANDEHHILGPKTQHRYRVSQGLEDLAPGESMKPFPWFVHCPGCYARRMDESGGLGRQLRGSWKYREPTGYEMENERALAMRSLMRDWEDEEPDD